MTVRIITKPTGVHFKTIEQRCIDIKDIKRGDGKRNHDITPKMVPKKYELLLQKRRSTQKQHFQNDKEVYIDGLKNLVKKVSFAASIHTAF